MIKLKHIRRLVVGVAILLVALLSAACSGEGEAGSVAAEGDSAAPATFAVSLTEFAISPPMIHAPAGQALSFTVTNDGTAPHTFAVDTENGVEQTPQIQPGDTVTLEVPTLAAGNYKTYCTIPGHEGAGMVGSLMVQAGAVVAAGTSGASGASGAHAGMSVKEMLDGHRESVEAFPAETDSQGNQPLEPAIENGVKVFELTAEEIRWETKPGVFVDAMGFNGTVPGPGDPRQPRRPRADRPPQRDDPADDPALPWVDRAERHGWRSVHHPGPDLAGRVLRVRVRRRRPTGHVRVPLALQFHRTGRQGPVRSVLRRTQGRGLEPRVRPADRRREHAVPRRRPHGLRAERQGVPGDTAHRREASATRC